MKRIQLVLSAAPSLLLLLAAGHAQRPAGTARDWEHEGSDLAVDPRIHFGELENGLRTAWMKNGEPRERSYLRLHVDVGSFAEEDSERGMAHFLEHMAFNGSEHFAAGTLVEWFQEHGMQFGADLNAFTSFSQTIYKLDLPQSDEETLREGLLVLRDWADGLLLEDEEVEREKGVVDGEEVESDSAGRRIQEHLFEALYSGTRYPVRLPIGVREVREAFTAESVRSFYERWYRPENMTLVLVGDLGELDPAELFAEYFADLAVPEGPVEPEPDEGEAALEERRFAVFESEVTSVSVHVARLVHDEDEPDTLETRTDDLDLACARRMIDLRFTELAKKEGAAFLSAGVSAFGGFDVYDGESLVVTAEPAKWKEALAAAEYELRRALEFGFQEAELDEVRADWRRALEEAVEREPTRHSSSFVSELLRAAEDRYVPTNAETDRGIVEPLLDEMTVERCHEALVEAWSEGVENVYTIGDLDLGETAAETLATALREARERPVEKGEEVAATEFAYASDPDEAGAFTSERHVEDLDAWLFSFENGVKLNVKATDFKERQILVSARLAEGVLTLPPEDYATGWVGVQVFDLGGLGAHTADDLRRLTAGRNVQVGLGWAADAFLLGGWTTADDLAMQLELLCARLSDPGWRGDGVRMIGDRVPLMFERLEHVATGPLVLEFLPELLHGDARFINLPPREAIEEVSMDDVREWLAPHLSTGPLEVTIVGDLDVDAVKEVAARTLGALPERRPIRPFTERREVAPPEIGLRMTRTVDTRDDKSLVMIAFPTDDGLETERRRLIEFLGGVVQDRLRIEVRERLGAAYSPGAGASPSTVFPGFGLLTIQSSVDPGKVEELVEASLRVAAGLRENGVTAEEVARLVEPVLKQIRDARRTNAFWANVLAEAQTRPETLADVRSLEGFYTGLEAGRLSELAARYLDPERASILVVNPSSAAAPGAPREDSGAEDGAGGGEDGG